MPDWTSRLAVSYTDDIGTHAIVPVDSFSPSFALAAEALHSIEQTHIGVIYSPKAMTFTISVKAIGDATAQLTLLAFAGSRFDIVLQETDDGTDWSFNKIMLSDCVLTSASPTTATISGAPAATFSGFSLAASAEPKIGDAADLP